MTRELAGVILAAGHGTRMRSGTPKVVMTMLGRPLLEFPLRLLAAVGCRRVVVVLSAAAALARARYADLAPLSWYGTEAPADPMRIAWAEQDPPRGTGDATRIGLEALGEHAGPVLILNADLPLLGVGTVRDLVTAHADHALTLLTVELERPVGYGRIVRAADGALLRIVEEADATLAQRALREVNGGIYVAKAVELGSALREVAAREARNAQGEVYLPDAVETMLQAGLRVQGHALAPGEEWQLQQVNDRVDLSVAMRLRRERIVQALQRSGVTVVDPATTWIEEDVEVGQDTTLHPFTVIQSGVRIGRNCVVGPFAHLRQGTVLADAAEVGNFTEVKNSRLGPGSRAKHLSYVGDATLGSGVNVGAGTIFANYDGTRKHPSVLGDEVFVGSGTVFVAPVKLGDRARTGAGAVVTAGTEVPAGETVVGVPARPYRKRPGPGKLAPGMQGDAEGNQPPERGAGP